MLTIEIGKKKRKKRCSMFRKWKRRVVHDDIMFDFRKTEEVVVTYIMKKRYVGKKYFERGGVWWYSGAAEIKRSGRKFRSDCEAVVVFDKNPIELVKNIVKQIVEFAVYEYLFFDMDVAESISNEVVNVLEAIINYEMVWGWDK